MVRPTSAVNVVEDFSSRFQDVHVHNQSPGTTQKDFHPSPLDYSELNHGRLQLKPHMVKGYVSPSGSLKVNDYQNIDANTLKLERVGRMFASGSAVVLNALAGIKLLTAGTKLISSSFGLANTDESYEGLSKAYSLSSIAGALTGIAHESWEWALGNLGMGFFSKHLDDIGGLSGFSIADGLSAIGMGKVRYKEGQNAYTVQHSIFNNQLLAPLSFLMPIEQSVISFLKRFTSKDGWKQFATDEPYALFKTAGGGLIAGGGLLGIAKLFQSKLSETTKSFSYLPYSLFSLVNLIALWRDGSMVSKRAKDFGGNKLSVSRCNKVEGFSKQTAAPILAINNFLLGLKGIGLDTPGNTVYNTAMGLRAIGAATALIGFGSQALLKFFKPQLFGPKLKEYIEILLNPKKTKEALFNLLQIMNDPTKRKEHRKPEKPVFTEFVNVIQADKYSSRLSQIIDSKPYQNLKKLTQTGLPVPSNPQTYNRTYLNRYSHSIGVTAIGIIYYDALLRNTSDQELKDYLIKNELAFKMACTVHDIGHIARSHVTEKAVIGHNNDENTLWTIKNPDSTIHKLIVENCGEEVLEEVLNIIGRKSPLFKILKKADRDEYQLFGDFASIENPRLHIPQGTLDSVHRDADTVMLYKTEQSTIDIAHTEEGAIRQLVKEYNRSVINSFYNEHFLAFAEAELLYALGLSANKNLAKVDIKTLPESEVDKLVRDGIDGLNGSKFPIDVEFDTGDDSYCGYSPNVPKSRITVMDENGNTHEVIDYIERNIREQDPDLYNFLKPKMDILTTPRRVQARIFCSNKFDFDFEKAHQRD